MEQRKWLYVALFVLTIVALGFFIITWQSGMPAGGGIGVSQSLPSLVQSPAEAATILGTWMRNNWAEDARLVGCTLTLSRRNPTEQNWNCQAYSAQKNRLLVALVQGQDVKMLRDVTALYPPTVLAATAWNKDIQDILKVWWREGGATAWNATSTATLTIHLGMREDGVPSWQFTVTRDKLNSLEYWEIHANTGTLLEHSTTGG
ncbi:MAG: hypothetical protein WHX52_20175 [Anaerolineae bacterium]